jgi:hypothetical protein
MDIKFTCTRKKSQIYNCPLLRDSTDISSLTGHHNIIHKICENLRKSVDKNEKLCDIIPDYNVG